MNGADKEIFGCYVSTSTDSEWTDDERNMAFNKGRLFRSYIWGESGIYSDLKRLKHENYGKDLMLVLFQFYVNPIPYDLQSIKEIESYRKREKSIAIPLVVNKKNFFCKCEEERYSFLRQSIIKKIDLLEEVIVHKKLDTKVGLLKLDLLKLWSHR